MSDDLCGLTNCIECDKCFDAEVSVLCNCDSCREILCGDCYEYADGSCGACLNGE